jgi:translation initiation factor IF-3
MEMAYSKLNELFEKLSHVAQVEAEPKLQGSQIIAILAPKRDALKARQDKQG